MSTFTQERRRLALSTPLGDNVFLLTGFQGREELSRLFTYRLDVLSERDDITARDIVGKNVTWTVNHSDHDPRFFNGYVSRFTAGGRGLHDLHGYRLEVVPWLWFLTRTADSRIFFPDMPEKTVKDVLKAVFADYPFADFDADNLGTDYPKHEHWVQYRETACNFVSRLMEDAGIYYFWVHEDGKHTLTLGDRKTHYRDCPEKFVPFADGGSLAAGQVSRWQHDYECRSGQVTHTDYNFETPKLLPERDLITVATTIIDLPDAAGFELFDYPGDYLAKPDGENRIKRRMEEEEAAFHVVRGGSNCSTFFPGGKFTLTDHDNEAEQDKSYVLTAVEHHGRDTTYGADGDSSYQNSFTAIPEGVVFRPARITMRPVVQGVQTAVVVGPPTDEIHTDQYGRIKVQFHWDRRGHRDEHSSCWIRVATPIAGNHWGMIHIPRIGQEVLVEFLEGDPNRPLVTGSVYNAGQMPPYPLPGSKRLSGYKSNSSPGGGGYNEIVFDDTKGKESITIHGQKDMATTVLNDSSHTVKGNRTVTVNGTSTEKIVKDAKITISEGNYTHTVSTGTATYTVQGALEEHYNTTQKTTVAKDITISSTGSEITLNGATKITLVSGKSQITLEKGGQITIKGVNILLDGGEDVKIGAPYSEVIGTDLAVLGGGKDGAQSVACDGAKVAVGGAMIHAESQGNHVIKGTLVKIN